jgi:hypothetical protein
MTIDIKIPRESNLAYAKNTIDELEKLSIECISWQHNEYQNSKNKLYNLLASVYRLHEEKFITASADDRRTLRQQLTDMLQPSTTNKIRLSNEPLSLLIRYVFKADRRRLHTYKSAIKLAKDDNILPDSFAQWVKDSGGLDKVIQQRQKSKKINNRSTIVNTATNQIEDLISKRSQSPICSVQVPVNATSQRVLMLAEPSPKGEYKIIYLFENPSESIQKSLIRQEASKQISNELELNSVIEEISSLTNTNSANMPDALIAT